MGLSDELRGRVDDARRQQLAKEQVERDAREAKMAATEAWLQEKKDNERSRFQSAVEDNSRNIASEDFLRRAADLGRPSGFAEIANVETSTELGYTSGPTVNAGVRGGVESFNAASVDPDYAKRIAMGAAEEAAKRIREEHGVNARAVVRQAEKREQRPTADSSGGIMGPGNPIIHKVEQFGVIIEFE